jgi:VanZ family protein
MKFKMIQLDLKILKRYFLLVLWCSVIFYFSSLPDLRITDKNILDFIVRKLAHISEYFILYALAFNSIRNKKYALIFCILYAASDEYHQTFIQGRMGCVRDVLIDSIGIFVGYFFAEKLKNLFKIKK